VYWSVHKLKPLSEVVWAGAPQVSKRKVTLALESLGSIVEVKCIKTLQKEFEVTDVASS